MSRIAQAIANDLQACVLNLPVQFLKTVAAAGTPELIATPQKHFRWALILGQKSLDGTTVNTGAVYIGLGSAVDTQPIAINSGGTYLLQPPNGAKFDFANWYVDADNNGDGIVVIYC